MMMMMIYHLVEVSKQRLHHAVLLTQLRIALLSLVLGQYCHYCH